MRRMAMAKEVTPDYSTPNKKKRFVETECQRTYKAVEQVNPEVESYLGGVYGIRRQKAILSYLDRAEEEFRSFGLGSIVETFTKNELMPFNNYNHLDRDFDLRIAAALWILGELRSAGTLGEAYDILPDASGDDIFYLPTDFAHPCFANDLIQSVIHVISKRYGELRGGVVITEGNAGRKQPSETYSELLNLLPEDAVQKACAEFMEKLWDLSTRFMKGQAYYDRELKKVVQEIEKANRGPATGPFALPISTPSKGSPTIGGLPGLDGFPGLPGAFGGGISDRNSAMEIALRGKELMDQSHDYAMDFDRYLWMDRRAVRKETGSRDVADAADGFSVNDPYELCFALFYLMDTGDDAPWLMRSGSSLMLYCLRMLPWHVEQDDWDEEDWDAWYDGLRYDREGWLEQEEVAEQIDFYHERHGDRNLAQIVYDLCRTVIPTGLHPFEQDRKRLIDEGMDQEKARKITDAAELLFLYEFQAKQRVASDFNFSWEDDEEEEIPNSMPVGPSPKLSGYWGKVMGQSTEEDEPEQLPAVDTDKLQTELSEAKKLIKSLRNSLAVARQEANNDRAKYEHELKALRLEHRELADLRELVFNQESSPDEQERREKLAKQYSYPYQTKKRTVVFGGHDSFLRAIKPMLPDVKFVDAQNLTYSPEIIRNADVVWIQNNCISHSQYWSIVKNCKLAGVQMRYFGYASAEKCAEQLVDWDQK